MIYSPGKSLYKAGEAPVAIVVLTSVLLIIADLLGFECNKVEAGGAGAVLYGMYKGIRNYIKNRDK